jgi:hypothetical protein
LGESRFEDNLRGYWDNNSDQYYYNHNRNEPAKAHECRAIVGETVGGITLLTIVVLWTFLVRMRRSSRGKARGAELYSQGQKIYSVNNYHDISALSEAPGGHEHIQPAEMNTHAENKQPVMTPVELDSVR